MVYRPRRQSRAMASPDALQQNLHQLRERIAAACARSSRPPASVRLLAVTKGVPDETVRAAINLGLTDVGENRIQEARLKQHTLGVRNAEFSMRIAHSALRIPHSALRWHLIGHLQRNKADDAVELFDVIQSLDSAELAVRLNRFALARSRSLEVMIQVNVSGEATKSGCAPGELPALVDALASCERLRLTGLMTIPPFVNDPPAARPHFRSLRRLRDQAAGILGHSAESLELSMGMSNDFEVAIEEGATVIRIGTALFGSRETNLEVGN